MPHDDAVLGALRDVVDPELGINVVDLGLVYETENDEGRVRVVMTMTTAACPLGESLAEDAKRAIRRRVPGVTSVRIDLVWTPAWQPAMMSAGARAQLGWS